MKDIKTKPMHELVKDLKDSNINIKVCEFALSIGVLQWSGGSVQERLGDNKHFVRVIEAEIERRRYGS